MAGKPVLADSMQLQKGRALTVSCTFASLPSPTIMLASSGYRKKKTVTYTL